MTKPPAISVKVLQFLAYKAEAEDAKKLAEEIKTELNQQVEDEGWEDAKGNKFFDLPKPITFGDKTYKRLKREKRLGLSFNPDKALELAESKGVRDRVVYTVEEVDQDEFYVLYQEDILTQDEIDSLFDRKETYAFVPVTD